MGPVDLLQVFVADCRLIDDLRPLLKNRNERDGGLGKEPIRLLLQVNVDHFVSERQRRELDACFVLPSNNSCSAYFSFNSNRLIICGQLSFPPIIVYGQPKLLDADTGLLIPLQAIRAPGRFRLAIAVQAYIVVYTCTFSSEVIAFQNH